MAVSDSDIDQFVDRVTSGGTEFSTKDQEIIQCMAVTISRQAQAIDKLSWELQGKSLFVAIANKAVTDSSVDKLPGLIGRAAGANFDFDAARTRIIEMNKAIVEANDLKEGLGAILKFAVFIAPLV